MSERERANALLEQVPDYQIRIVIAYMQGIIDGALITPDIPNDETIAAMHEFENGTGQTYTGSTADIFAAVLAEED